MFICTKLNVTSKGTIETLHINDMKWEFPYPIIGCNAILNRLSSDVWQFKEYPYDKWMYVNVHESVLESYYKEYIHSLIMES